MRYGFLEGVAIGFAVFFALGFFLFFGFMSDRVEITLVDSYLQEYIDCEHELETVIPECPNCVCESESWGLLIILSFGFGVVICLTAINYFFDISLKEEFAKKLKSKNKKDKEG